MNKINISTLFLLLLLTKLTIAANIDTLHSSTIDNDSDSILFNSRINIFDHYINIDIDSATQYLSYLYGMSSDSSFSRLARCYIREGILMQYLHDYDKAEVFYKKAHDFFYKINDYEGVASCLNNIGTLSQRRGDFIKAGENFFNQLRIADSISDKKLQSIAYTNIGLLFYSQEQYNEAMNHYEKAIKLKKEIDDKRGQALVYNNLASIYYFMDEPDKALNSFKESLSLYIACEDIKGQAMPFYNIGEIYFNNFENFEKALYYYKQSYNIEYKLGDITGQATSLSKIGNCYRAINKLDLALNMQLESIRLIEEYKMELFLSENFFDIANTYEIKKDYKNALKYFKIYQSISDSLSNMNVANEILKLEEAYETEKQEKENIQSSNEQIILKLQIDNQLKDNVIKRYLSIIILISLLTILLLLFLLIKVYSKNKYVFYSLLNKTAQKNSKQKKRTT